MPRRSSKQVKPDAKPTWTYLVEQALKEADDFMSLAQLVEKTGAAYNQATAALSHLRKRRAVDSLESGGALWWFATPNTDNRSKTVEERVPEEPGSRRRGMKKSSTYYQTLR